MMNAIAKPEVAKPSVSDGGNPLIPKTLDDAARLAKIMSEMSLVPSHLQGKPADCMLIIEQAHRWRMSPFAVAQATSVLQGKLNYEGKLVAAAVHTSGLLSTRLHYAYEGEGASRAVRVSATVAGESEPRDLLVKLADVKTANKMWQTQPDQQLSYAGARIWARRHAPEVMLGVYSPEEWTDDRPEPRPEPRPVQSVQSKPSPPALAPTSLRDMRPVPSRAEIDKILDNDQIPALEPEPEPDRAADGVTALEARVRAAATEDELHAITGDPEVAKKRAWLAKHRPELDTRLADALGQRYDELVAARQEAEEVPA